MDKNLPRLAPDNPKIIEPNPRELKPCPFCNGDAAFEHTETGFKPTWHVYCRDTNNECPMAYSNTIGYARRVEAATAWNRRAS